MIRKIIKIDEKKCNGCGTCAAACHEGAIKMPQRIVLYVFRADRHNKKF